MAGQITNYNQQAMDQQQQQQMGNGFAPGGCCPQQKQQQPQWREGHGNLTDGSNPV